MRTTLLCILFFMSISVFAQSKKELQDEVNKLKNEIAELKKPRQPDLSNEHKKASYGLGVLMASNFVKQGADSLDVESIMFGMADVYQKRTPKIGEQECMAIVQPYMQKSMERRSSQAKEEGLAFLNANKTKEGVITTSTGLQYKVIATGQGKSPGPTDNVTVHYTGKLINGTVFDSSINSGKPLTYGVGNFIAGWTEALQKMHEGDKWMLFIPYQLAYGERGSGAQIPPFSTLIFEIELIKVN